MKEVTRWVTEGGTVCETQGEAGEIETRESMVTIIESLDLYWRETSAKEVVDALFEGGYKIVSV